jgi:hypothetical protein
MCMKRASVDWGLKIVRTGIAWCTYGGTRGILRRPVKLLQKMLCSGYSVTAFFVRLVKKERVLTPFP